MPLASPEWSWISFPVIFGGMWVAVCFMLARLGGWAELANHHGKTTVYEGNKFRFCSGSFRWVAYNNCLNFTVGSSGLGISVMFLFKPGHPTLSIPWSDISISQEKVFFKDVVRLKFTRASSVTLTLPAPLAERMQLGGRIRSE